MENIKNNIKGVIFDYGGTIDSRGEHWSEVIWRAYQHENVPVLKEQFRECYVFAERELAKTRHILPHHNFLDLLKIKIKIEMGYLADNGLIPQRVADEKSDAIALRCYNEAKSSVEEARPVLEELKKHFPMVLVSNFYGNVEAVLDDFDLSHFFNSIVESAVVGVRKPDPKIFALGVEALGLNPEEVLVIGDSYKKDILPAESLGCKVLWIKGKGWTDDEDAQQHPNIIQKLTQVLDVAL